ncbi:hypothetical protein ACTI_73190 [Actinoplanes sp. OR16]|uniref:chitosanase n=1 Tax=Actinoplanes sp. OR16 TaxID=946334 RepID=UPI000F6F7478|nr:chitosanase [Actinoplanes sp. OR16]BBH70634.1 hypothetical protein ACTI_73190 [Actinoplanes sp. OR16]
MFRVKTAVYAVSGLILISTATIYGLLPASAATVGPIKGFGGRCIDAGARLSDCDGSAAQQWTVDGTLRALGRCLDVAAAGTASGTKVQMYDCNGTGAQEWTVSGGALVNPASGRCLDVTGRSTANGAPLQIWTCTGAANQTWTLPGASTPPPASGKNLDDPAKKDVAMQIVSAAENSSLDWRAQFSYIQDIDDGRGYTAGIIGFCSGTGDMLELVEAYTAAKPSNVLATYLPALRRVNGTASHAGLDPNFTRDWRTAAADPVFQAAQESERDRVYFNPSVRDGKSDGVRALGQFAYYDASVVHGYSGMRSIRSRALARAKPPAQGGDERAWLNAFLDERVVEMKKEAAHDDVTRIDTAQRVFLNNGNFDLNTPLDFKVYGDPFHIG